MTSINSPREVSPEPTSGQISHVYELNLRLDVIGAENTDAEIASQLKKALSGLRKLGKFEYHCDSYPTRFGRFHFLMARVHSKDWDVEAIHALSVRLRQRCISVYSEVDQRGALIGPKTADYNRGQFDLKYFQRFKQVAVHHAQGSELTSRRRRSTK